MGDQDDGGQDPPVDTTDLVSVLNQIANTDDVALAATSSDQIDGWLAVLSRWQEKLSGDGVA
ncbi:hypothetical protein [Mycobacterium sp.]|uniref:hypothetical protein n=1 Tax=Mycobacterium sp. TaxID=1785 RepID=UPI003D0F9B45